MNRNERKRWTSGLEKQVYERGAESLTDAQREHAGVSGWWYPEEQRWIVTSLNERTRRLASKDSPRVIHGIGCALSFGGAA